MMIDERTPSLSELSPSEIEVRPAAKSRKWTTVVAACCVAVVIAGASVLVTLAVTGQLSSEGVGAAALADCADSDGHVESMLLRLGASATPIGRAVTPDYVITSPRTGRSGIIVMQAFGDVRGDDIALALLTTDCEVVEQEPFGLRELIQ